MLPMSEAYPISIVFLEVLTSVRSSMRGSIGDDICLLGVILNRLEMVYMNEGWDKCMVPSSLSLWIFIPNNQVGPPRSDISKLPQMSLTILDIREGELDARSPSSTYQPAISISPLLPKQK